jgi:hypothetical protein
MLRFLLALLMILLARGAASEAAFTAGAFMAGASSRSTARRSRPCFFGGYVCATVAARVSSAGVTITAMATAMTMAAAARHMPSAAERLNRQLRPRSRRRRHSALIIPTNCWVRRAAYDPSGAYFGQVLVDLCRPSDSVTVAGSKGRGKTPDIGPRTGQPPVPNRSDAPQSP